MPHMSKGAVGWPAAAVAHDWVRSAAWIRQHIVHSLSTATIAATALGSTVALASPPETGFLCCNMRTDGSWISDSNYAETGKRVVALGTPVKFLGYGRYRVHIEIEGRRQAIGNDYSRDLSMEAFAARHIVANNPRDALGGLAPKIRTAIETARVARGMNREQVAMAVGYPISSETPNLDVRVWKYWLWSFSPFSVNFGENGLVTSMTTDADTLLKVFLD